jgi:hypothetical protein
MKCSNPNCPEPKKDHCALFAGALCGLCQHLYVEPKNVVPYSVRQAKRKKTLALIRVDKSAKRAAIRRRKKRMGKI